MALIEFTLLISLIWIVVLPWLGEQPALRERMAREDQRGIDPSAMFYSELEAMSDIDHRVDTLRQRHPEAFWSFSAAEDE